MMDDIRALEAHEDVPATVWADEDIDDNIRGLVEELNSMPGITTIGSCGGHENPDDSIGQRPFGEWFVTFHVSLRDGGWRSLDLLASMFRYLPGTYVDAFSNCPGCRGRSNIVFGLVGRGSIPELAEALLKSLRTEIWQYGIGVDGVAMTYNEGVEWAREVFGDKTHSELSVDGRNTAHHETPR